MGFESIPSAPAPKAEKSVDQAVKMEAELREIGNEIIKNEQMLEEIRAGKRAEVGTSRGSMTEENLAKWISEDREKQSELSRQYSEVLARVNAGEK